MKTWLGLLTVLILSNSAIGMNLLPELYTEQAFLARESVVQQTTRLRLFESTLERFRPYVTAGSEMMSGGPNATTLDIGGSYAYGGIGLRIGRPNFQWFNELRGRAFYTYRPSALNSQEALDYRSLIVLSHQVVAPLASGSDFSFLFEPYMEILYTSGDFNNVISAGYARTGVRYRLNPQMVLDAYVEPYAVFDRVRHFYNNRADIKPTLRFMVNSSTVGGALMVSYLWNKYFDRGDFDPNPYRYKNEGMRVLAVLGATF